jgi:hypothetical protein
MMNSVGLKGEVGNEVGEWGMQCGSWWLLWSVCLFGCISFVVECACVRYCRGLCLCKVGILGCSVGNKCVGGV